MMAFEQIPKKDWYSILGADPSASVSDLKQKYQKLVLMGKHLRVAFSSPWLPAGSAGSRECDHQPRRCVPLKQQHSTSLSQRNKRNKNALSKGTDLSNLKGKFPKISRVSAMEGKYLFGETARRIRPFVSIR